jgi:hypothetical protein
VNSLRIAIDPALVQRFGPEIYWVWQTVLVSMGWAWQEVPLGEPCDLAYAVHPECAASARVCLRADVARWERVETLRFERIGRWQTLAHPLYTDERSPAAPVHLTPNSAVCGRDLVLDIFWLVTGVEERFWPKNKHGHLDYTGSPVQAQRLPDQALASTIIHWLKTTLLQLGCPPPAPRWPNGKRAAAAASHDVDYPEVIRWLEPARMLLRSGLRDWTLALDVATGRRHHWQFEAWMAMEQSLGMRSAFYFMSRCGSLWEYATHTPDSFYDITQPHFRALIQRMVQAGWEVNMHASYHAYRSVEQLAAEKHAFEAIMGQPASGNRHHYWHLDPHSPDDTLWLHERIGLHYDSSLTNNRYLGWRRGLCEPYFPFHPRLRRTMRTLQLPVAWMDDQLFRMRASNPGDRTDRLRTLIENAADCEGLFIADMHEYVFDPQLYPDWSNCYGWVWQHIRERGDFWCATPMEINTHWRNRAEALIKASAGLGVNGQMYADVVLA